MILVDSVKATAAAPRGELTSTRVPDTEAIDPLTSSSPSMITGTWEASAADVVAPAAADDAADDAVDDTDEAADSVFVAEPHATADSAVIPTSARIR
jgi:hypothetical protein